MSTQSRVLLMLVAMLVAGYFILFVNAGLSLSLFVFSAYIVFLLNIIRKLFP